MTSCEQFIRELLIKQKYLSVAELMEIALTHPTHGYYRNQTILGRYGDFTTAPEVSQMYGEMIGAWCINIWQQLNCPASFHLVELGPGKGTLLADILRVGEKTAGFLEALSLHLVEIHPHFKKLQKQNISHPRIDWYEKWEDIPPSDVPLIVIANEFFDALPIRQIESRGGTCYERFLHLMNNKLCWASLAAHDNLEEYQEEGTHQFSPRSESLITMISGSLKTRGGAALIVDYGYEEGHGDSLQAIYQGKPCEILKHIGEADLSCHVNFRRLKCSAEPSGIHISPILTQGLFLTNLGIEMRAQALRCNATSEQSALIQSALERLTHPLQMGMLFKVMCLYWPSSLYPAGF